MKSEADREIDELIDKGDNGCKFWANCETCPYKFCIEPDIKKAKKKINKVLDELIKKMGGEE